MRYLRDFYKWGQPGKLTGCEDDFGCLVGPCRGKFCCKQVQFKTFFQDDFPLKMLMGLCHIEHVYDKSLHSQGAKKVLSDGPGLV